MRRPPGRHQPRKPEPKWRPKDQINDTKVPQLPTITRKTPNCNTKTTDPRPVIPVPLPPLKLAPVRFHGSRSGQPLFRLGQTPIGCRTGGVPAPCRQRARSDSCASDRARGCSRPRAARAACSRRGRGRDGGWSPKLGSVTSGRLARGRAGSWCRAVKPHGAVGVGESPSQCLL